MAKTLQVGPRFELQKPINGLKMAKFWANPVNITLQRKRQPAEGADAASLSGPRAGDQGAFAHLAFGVTVATAEVHQNVRDEVRVEHDLRVWSRFRFAPPFIRAIPCSPRYLVVLFLNV